MKLVILFYSTFFRIFIYIQSFMPSWISLLFILVCILGIKTRALCLPGKSSSTEPLSHVPRVGLQVAFVDRHMQERPVLRGPQARSSFHPGLHEASRVPKALQSVPVSTETSPDRPQDPCCPYTYLQGPPLGLSLYRTPALALFRQCPSLASSRTLSRQQGP